MIGLNRNINNIFFIFVLSHLLIWTVDPTITNKNLPLDVIEALAWGSNLDWGFNKHPPGSAFFPEVFFQIFGAQDWAYYFLSSLFTVISFYFVFKFANEILQNKLLSLFSVLILEAMAQATALLDFKSNKRNDPDLLYYFVGIVICGNNY